MNTRRFVSGSSVILAGWLGATFLNEVPAQRYPKLDKKPATAGLADKNDRAMIATVMNKAAAAAAAPVRR